MPLSTGLQQPVFVDWALSCAFLFDLHNNPVKEVLAELRSMGYDHLETKSSVYKLHVFF